MRRISPCFPVLLIVAAGFIAPAIADASPIVFSQAPPNWTLAAPTIVNRAQAADFTAPEDFLLTDVHFYSLEGQAVSGWWGSGQDLEWYLWEGGVAPSGAADWSGNATNIARTQEAGTSTVAGILFDRYSWSFDLDNPVSLLGGSTYWLGLYVRNSGLAGSNLALVGWASYDVALAGDCGSNTGTNINIAAATWTCTGKTNRSFELTGQVPEPMTLVLFGIGLAGAGIGRRSLRR